MNKKQILLAVVVAFFAGVVSANTVDISALHLTKCGVIHYLNDACAQQAEA
jgi:hypothetical protein